MNAPRDERFRKAVRRLLFVSPLLSRAFLSGGFRSAFKGRGMDFDSIREYAPEDDARSIDWNASMRFGRPFIKTYREDRALSIFVVFDESASMRYGSDGPKAGTAAVAASLVAYAAARAGAPVGALFFADKVGDSFPPSTQVTRPQALASRFEASTRGPKPRGGSALAEAADAARRSLKRRSLVFFVSDFLASAEGPGGWSRPFALLARRHDVVALRVYDDPDAVAGTIRGSVRVADAETGRIERLKLGKGARDGDFAEEVRDARFEWLRAVAASRAARVELRAGEDPAKALVAFFERRRRAG